jgi:hypothetical protein
MTHINIKLIDNATDKYIICRDTNVVGRQYDNGAVTLTIERPEAEANRTLILIAERNGVVIDNIPAVNNAVTITSNLSQYREVRIGFCFYDSTGYRKNSEALYFEFLPALRPLDFVPQPPEASEIIFRLLDEAIVRVEIDKINSEYIFLSTTGTEKGRIKTYEFDKEGKERIPVSLSSWQSSESVDLPRYYIQIKAWQTAHSGTDLIHNLGQTNGILVAALIDNGNRQSGMVERWTVDSVGTIRVYSNILWTGDILLLGGAVSEVLMGISTAIEIADPTTESVSGAAERQSDVNAGVKERLIANATAISTEATARAEADDALQGDINAETLRVNTELDKKANKITYEHIDWNALDFNIPAGRTLQFDTSKTPALTNVGISTSAIFAMVNNNPDLMFGFYTNDDGATTHAGMFRVNTAATAFVPIVELYNSTTWLNGGQYVLLYGITGDFNQNIGAPTLSGFDLQSDITVLDVPDEDLEDVKRILDAKKANAADTIHDIEINGMDLPKMSGIVNIPLAGATNDGAMSKEDYVQVTTNTADMEVIKGKQVAFINANGEIEYCNLNELDKDYHGLAADTYVDKKIAEAVSGVLHYVADVATYADLPATANMFDLYAVLDESHGYYWFGDEWNLLDFSIDLSAYYTTTETDSLLALKVDKVDGKGLSTNDYTTAEKNKLSGIEAGAQKNVAETDPTVPAWAKASTKPGYTASEVGAADADDTNDRLDALESGLGDIAAALDIINGEAI